MSGDVIKNTILESLKQYNPLFIGLFVSYAKNQQTDNTDIDILASFQNGISLLKLIRLEKNYLSSLILSIFFKICVHLRNLRETTSHRYHEFSRMFLL